MYKTETSTINICYIDIYIKNKNTIKVIIFSENSLLVYSTSLSPIASRSSLGERPFFHCSKTKGWGGIGFWGELWLSNTSICSTYLSPMSSRPDICNCLMSISCSLWFLTEVILNRVNPRTSFPRICLVVGGKTLLL